MNKEVEQKLKTFLHNVFGCVLGEERGDTERISDSTSSDEMINLVKELGFNDLAEEFQNDVDEYL
jgi:hypothetical protein